MSVVVEPISISSRRERNRFIELPYRLRRDDPQWVPPLRAERRRFLDPRRNPWFDHSEAQFFLALRGGEVVGRISAHIDYRWDEYQGGNDGMFGFYESVEDPEVAAALLEAATSWLRERGRERMLGPMDFTLNDECGLLIEGFDEPVMILEPWHPPYYQRLLEGWGLTKAMDLLMWRLKLGELAEGDAFTPMIHKAAEHAAEQGVRVRKMRKRDMEAEVARFQHIYNRAWGRNWGFVPITEDEVRFQAESLKPVLDEDWAMVAERNGEPIGAALTLPDINQVLARMRGRIFPFGWWYYLRRRKLINRLRVFALGVLPEHQGTGAAASLYLAHLENALSGLIKWGHMGWILETNEPMNRAMEGMGGKLVKRYRIYEQAL